ncbi:transcription repressor NadR [Marinilactibacillus sp. 15R]|uniref:transcription repressor NadR n=1 Tax=Marinilactibacillus sp. 15R TaxID=1911586 RepID=UPI00090AB62D|nr:transcription repressor NadR [Marinilactibacillus sp. 15R]API89553.1 transcription repressor NadR [Marinilactibacillus sp. 15R]
MEAEIRRATLLSNLKEANEPIIARSFAEQFDVSRQVIVGDIALLRAEGQEILSTPKGYVMRSNSSERQERRIVCQHTFEQTLEELYLIVDHGGEVIDVIVEHPIYGEMVGGLNISSRLEANEFIQKIKNNKTTLLAELTGGLHSHTISAKDQLTLDQIVEALKEKNLIYY